MTPSSLFSVFAGQLQNAAAGEDALAPLLLAVATWALAEDDTIDLAFLDHARPDEGHLGFNRRRAYADRPGLEGLLLRAMAGQSANSDGFSPLLLLATGLPVKFGRERRHDSLRHAIESGPWRGRERAVVRLAQREARRAGVRPGDEMPGAAEMAFRHAQARFAAFERDRPDLHRALLGDCRAGLRR